MIHRFMFAKPLCVVLTLTLLAGTAYACKCGGESTVAGSFRSSDMAISGRVLSRVAITFSQTVHPDSAVAMRNKLSADRQKLNLFDANLIFKVELEVLENFKGALVSDTVTVYTAMLSASCGYRFEVGTTYLVYGSQANDFAIFFGSRYNYRSIGRRDTWWTNHCTKTSEYNTADAQELKALAHH